MGKNWAICIGINQYDNLQRLDYAKRDAEAMRDYLQGELGCLPEQVLWGDNYGDSSKKAPTDGSAWICGGDSDYRLIRGGSWINNPRCCRCADRNWGWPDVRGTKLGLRVVCASAWALS